MKKYLSSKKLTDKDSNGSYTLAMDPKMLLATNILRIRKLQDLTQTALARKSSITRKHLCKIEKGEVFPSSAILEQIATALGVPISYLFIESEEYKDFDLYTHSLRALEKLLPEICRMISDEVKKSFLSSLLEETKNRDN